MTTVLPLSSTVRGRTRESRLSQLEPLLARRILLLDGAMGTMIQSYHLGEADYRGDRFADWPRDLKGNNDLLALTQPAIIRAIHSAYLEAGADILETNSFNSTAISMADYGMEQLVYELNQASARLARDVADEFETRESSWTYCRSALAPRAQLSPTVRGRLCATEFQNASVVWPESVRPLASVMVPEIMMGTLNPTASKCASMAKSAALAFSVSKMVSTSRRSAPPSSSPRTASP